MLLGIELYCADHQIYIAVGHLRSSCCGAPSLTRGRVCNLLYSCFWALPEQSLSGPAQLTAIFYCLGPGSLVYIPQEQGGPAARTKPQTHALCVVAATFVIPSRLSRAEM
jgi:hypothetical protein